DRDGRNAFLAVRPRTRAALAGLFEVTLELRDAALDAPAVDLELRLTGPTRSDGGSSSAAASSATAARTTDAGERFTPAAQSRQSIRELRELDLLLAFDRSGTLREDVEDQDRPVDDLR